MKILLIPLMLFLFSCCKDENVTINPDCALMKSNSNFKTEPFKEGYTIQFPVNYSGIGLQTTPFVRFSKANASKIAFFYTYNSDISSNVYFGQKLSNPIPDQLQSPSQLLTENLHFKKEFCLGNDTEAILYYNLDKNAISFGKLFMKHNDWYYEGLEITFQENLLEELESVIKTIKKQ